ncbi:MAG: hypothetical protein ACOYT8_01935 [Candidatus Dependentiae bacterium]
MKRLLTLLLFISTALSAKVLIITHNYNRPDFIELQHKTFKKFLKDDYEYVVFNDATSDHMRQNIYDMCNRYHIRCIEIPQEIHTRPYCPRLPGDNLQQNNYRHSNCVQYSLDVIGYDHDGVVFIIDSDCLLVRPFSIEDYMADKHISGRINRPRNKIQYCSPLFCMIAMNKIPDKKSLNFNAGTINGILGDTGAWSYYYMQEHPELKIIPVHMTFSHQLFLGDRHINKPADVHISDELKRSFYEHYGFTDIEIAFLLNRPDTFEYYLDLNFVHYRGSSYEQDGQKMSIFNNYFNDILAN